MTSGLKEGHKRATGQPTGDLMKELHADRLAQELQKLAAAMGTRAATSLLGKVEGAAGRLTDYAEGGGSGLLSSLAAAAGLGVKDDHGSSLKNRLTPGFNAAQAFVTTKLKQKLKKGGKGKKLKITNIVETLDVGVPLRLAYDQWTQFEDFPSFMKKVESVEQASDEKLNWKAQVFWSHRTWESSIIEQVPDKRIVWRSKGPKGWVDGAVTFHELAPELTRIMLVLEYHPQGLFERTGNIWRAQGRRVRLELKHFRRHVMTQTVLRPDEIDGWRGEIRDGEVVKDHETALREEREAEAAREEEPREEEERPEEAGETEYETEYEEGYEEEPEDEDYGEPEAGYEYDEESEQEEPGDRDEDAQERDERTGRRDRDRRGRRGADRPKRSPGRAAPRAARARRG